METSEDPEVLRGYYRQMTLIRAFELRAAEMYTRAKIGGYCHLNLGEEATVTGLMAALRQDDYLFTTYREHGYALARGADPGRVMAELFGRTGGLSRGRGGSMHLFDPDIGLLGGYGIVGGQIPPATGAAFALAYRGGPGPDAPAVMCLLGDATTNIGAFHESLNLAALWRLPVVYVIVNNQLGMGTPVEAASAEPDLWKRGCSYRIPGQQVDGNDVLAVRDAARTALERARGEHQPGPPPAARARTSPLARKLAREHGIDLATVSGSGPGARIVRADIEDAIRKHGRAQPAPAPGLQPVTPAAAGPTAPAPARPAAPIAAAPLSAVDAEADEIPLSTVRRLTAERLAASAREAPHFYLTVVADAGELLAFRAQLNERRAADIKVSVTDLLIKACAVALAAHPEINVSWDQTRILRHRRVNIGVAVAIEDGLIVPVIRDADHKTLTEISREARDLTVRARARRLAPDELSGGTFMVSNLGMYGIRQFTAVINPPQAAILAIGEAVRQPVVRGDQVAVGTTMALTLFIDHRAVDGAVAAAFLTALRELIEEPLCIVV